MNGSQDRPDHEVDPAAHPIDILLDQLDQTVTALTEQLTAPQARLVKGSQLIDWTQQLEHCTNRLAVPTQHLVGLMQTAGCHTDTPISLFSSMEKFLVALLQISHREAKDRVRAADLLTEQSRQSGEIAPVRYPTLAAAQQTGTISTERMSLVTEALTDWERLQTTGSPITDQALQIAADALAVQAPVLPPAQLKKVIEQIGDHLNPDGDYTDPRVPDQLRSLKLTRIRRGLHKDQWRIEGYLSPIVGAQLNSALGGLSRPSPVKDQDGRIVEHDHRPPPVRLHDALAQFIATTLRAPDLPGQGGTPTTLIIRVNATDLLDHGDEVDDSPADDHNQHDQDEHDQDEHDQDEHDQDEHDQDDVAPFTPDLPPLRYGYCEDGTRLPITDVKSLADEADIYRVVFSKEKPEPLYLGRTRRIASTGQTMALVARDRGCSFPGCDKSPKWCQRHHIVDWLHGGPHRCQQPDPDLCLPPLPIRRTRLDRTTPRRPHLVETTQDHRPRTKNDPEPTLLPATADLSWPSGSSRSSTSPSPARLSPGRSRVEPGPASNARSVWWPI